MDDVTRILNAVEAGQTEAAEELLPLAYKELKRIAANKMATEREGHTLQPTALVHEAYIRLVGTDGGDWRNGRSYFFAAAAEAMRRILIEHARRKASQKRGGNAVATEFDEMRFEAPERSEQLLAVDEALARMEEEYPELAMVVKLRYFAGMTIPETAEALGVSVSTVNRNWNAGKVWLYREIGENGDLEER